MRSLRTRPAVLSSVQDGVGANDNRCTIGEQRDGIDLAYTAGYGASAISIWNVTVKASPVKLATYVHAELLRANGLALVKQGSTYWLLVACGGDEIEFMSKLVAVDVTDPANPSFENVVEDLDALGGARKVQVLDGRAYVAAQRVGGVGIVDVSALPAMTVLGHTQPDWLDIVHGVEPYKLTIQGQERVWAFVANSGNPSSFGVLDCTDPANIALVCNSVDNPLTYDGQEITSQRLFDGGAGVTLIIRDDRYFAIVAVANNDGVVVVEIVPTGPSTATMVLHRPNFRDETRTSSPQHVIAIREPGRGLDADWVMVCAQNQAPLPGGFDGAVVTYDTTRLPYIRLAGEIRQINTAWRACRHLHQPLTPSGRVGANWVVCALKVGNGFAVLESPAVAPRYLPNLSLPADWPAGPANRWQASSLALAAGSAVDSWPNDANGANPLVQATAANRPTFRRLQAAGKPAVEFDGANDFLKTTDLNPASYPRPRTVAVVASFSSVALNSDSTFGSPRLLDSGVVNPAVQWLLAGRNPNGTFNEIRFINGGTNLTPSAVLPLGRPLVVILTLEGTTGRLVIGGFIEASSSSIGADVPAGYTVGAKPDGLSPLNGKIYEVLDWSRTFDADEINHAGRHARVAYGCPWVDVAA